MQDVVALVIQAVGGGTASGSSAQTAKTGKLIRSTRVDKLLIAHLFYVLGGNIMLGGIVFQLGEPHPRPVSSSERH